MSNTHENPSSPSHSDSLQPLKQHNNCIENGQEKNEDSPPPTQEQLQIDTMERPPFRHSRLYKNFKNPPQPHMCICVPTINGEDVFINVMSWTRIVMPRNPNSPIPLYGGMRVPQNSPRSPPLVYAVMANPDVLKESGRNCKDTEILSGLVELMCDFVEAMNPELKLSRTPVVLKDRDLSGELKDIWSAVQEKRDRERNPFAAMKLLPNITDPSDVVVYTEFGPESARSYSQNQPETGTIATDSVTDTEIQKSSDSQEQQSQSNTLSAITNQTITVDNNNTMTKQTLDTKNDTNAITQTNNVEKSIDSTDTAKSRGAKIDDKCKMQEAKSSPLPIRSQTKSQKASTKTTSLPTPTTTTTTTTPSTSASTNNGNTKEKSRIFDINSCHNVFPFFRSNKNNLNEASSNNKKSKEQKESKSKESKSKDIKTKEHKEKDKDKTKDKQKDKDKQINLLKKNSIGGELKELEIPGNNGVNINDYPTIGNNLQQEIVVEFDCTNNDENLINDCSDKDTERLVISESLLDILEKFRSTSISK